MTASALIEPITGKGGTVTLPEAEHWMQGRTLYGGASALIAYTAAIRAFPDLPMLRAGQIGFVAPVGSQMELRSKIIRQGRNVTQVRSEIVSDGNIALTAFWLFGTDREPNARHAASTFEASVPPPQQSETVMAGKGPAFIQNNFELRRAQTVRGSGEPVVRRWIRLKHSADIDPISQLVLLGDTLPPGAMRAMKRQGPISSINWSFNILDTAPSTGDGWWLAETSSEWADHGYSSERLRLWKTDGKLVMSGMQAAAVFG